MKPPTARHWLTTYELQGSRCVAELPGFPAEGEVCFPAKHCLISVEICQMWILSIPPPREDESFSTWYRAILYVYSVFWTCNEAKTHISFFFVVKHAWKNVQRLLIGFNVRRMNESNLLTSHREIAQQWRSRKLLYLYPAPAPMILSPPCSHCLLLSISSSPSLSLFHAGLVISDLYIVYITSFCTEQMLQY